MGRKKEVRKAVDSKAKPLPYLTWLRYWATFLDHGVSPVELMMYHNLCPKLQKLQKNTNSQKAA